MGDTELSKWQSLAWTTAIVNVAFGPTAGKTSVSQAIIWQTKCLPIKLDLFGGEFLIFRLDTIGKCHTYTVVPSMQEVKQLLSTILRRRRPGANSGLTMLQTLPSVNAVFCLFTLLSHRFKGILKQNMQHSEYVPWWVSFIRGHACSQYYTHQPHCYQPGTKYWNIYHTPPQKPLKWP